jgi:HlyD family secretion protein
MNIKNILDRLPPPLQRRPVLFAAAAILLLGLVVLILRPAAGTGASTGYHEVKRGDFTVTIVEGGALAAVSEVSIRNEVEGTARIISIVPEGTYVKKGDLLVELDSAQAQDQVNLQQINYEKAKFAVEQARAQLEIQKSATNSDFMTSSLKLKFAKIDRDKYERGQRVVDLIEASNRLVQAQSQLAVNLDTYINSTNLANKGYETKQKVDGDRLAVLNTRNSLIVASNGIWMLQDFDMVKQHEKFEADVLQAEEELERVVNQNRRKMAQFEADLQAQINTLELSQQKLERDKKNLAATKIYAPQDGLVVYQVSENRFSSESLIEGGAIVRNRQELIKLPDLSRMKVTIKVHESHVNMVRPGLPAFVTLDSNPDERYQGYVERVAPLPDTQSRWGNPNLKVYNTDIYITEAIPKVKPGVSAKAEVVITNISNSLSVPIQVVTTRKGKQVAYLVNGGRKPEPTPVEVGMFNTKFIEVLKGLKEGDRVLLSPPFDTQEKDLEGAVLAADERVRIATNRPPPFAAPFVTPARAGEPVAMNAPGPGGEESPAKGRRNGLSQEEALKQFDKNGDGKLDDPEREAMRAAMAVRFGGEGGQGRPRMSSEEMLKRFDKNGDGRIDEEERAAMRASFGSGKRGPLGEGPPGERGAAAPRAPQAPALPATSEKSGA